MTTFLSRAKEIFPYTRDLRRDFHRHPELGFQEQRTSQVIIRELEKLPGIKLRTGLAETGVVGLLKGGGSGKTVLLRFDMDALPITEETGAPYASENPGLMHACGHDGHVAIGLTTARMVHQDREGLSGQVKFVFQPAEEGLGGAERMIAEGVLENPRPDVNLALHLWNEKPLGWFAISDGPLMAASDRFNVVIQGKSGHGAKPHEAADPVVAAAEVISALQTIVSREVPPLESGVITVSTVEAGQAHNVIPSTVVCTGTIRSFTPEIRELLLRRCNEVVSGVSQAFRCQGNFRVCESSPAVVNHAQVAAELRATAGELFPKMEIAANYRTMVSEDMALMMEDIPSCYCLIGSGNPDLGLTARHHQPDFDFDERALLHGAALLTAAVNRLLG